MLGAGGATISVKDCDGRAMYAAGMSRRFFAAALPAVLAVYACAADGSVVPEEPVDAVDAGEVFESGGPSFVAEAGSDAGAARPANRHEAGCTSDLRYRVDDSGNAQAECPVDRGCFESSCIPVCDAAAAARGAEGCEFLVTTPARPAAGPCQVAVVTNVWRTPMTITLSRGSRVFDVAKVARVVRRDGGFAEMPPFGLPSGMTAYLFLSGYSDYGNPGGAGVTSALDCPFPKAIDGPTAIAGPVEASGRGAAFRIRTSVPAIVHDLTPFAWTTSPGAMSLLLPTSAWGKDYGGASPSPRRGPFADLLSTGVAQIVAQEPTTVTVLPGGDMPAGPGVARARHDTKTTYTLNAGEWIQWQGLFDFAGTRIESDRPIGVIGGSTAFGLPLSIAGGNPEETLGSYLAARIAASQAAIVPIDAAESEYVALPYTGRRFVERVPYRIVGLVDGATLSYDPPLIEGAPAMLAAGESAIFYTYRAFSVRSQDAAHPFLLFQEGGSVAEYEWNSSSYLEEYSAFVPMLSPSRFRTEIVVPPVPSAEVSADPSKAQTVRPRLAIVRRTKTADCHEVYYECDGERVAVRGWQPVGYGGAYEYAYPDLDTRPNPSDDDAGSPVLPCGEPRPLVQRLVGDEPFAAFAMIRARGEKFGWLEYVPSFAARGAGARYREKACTEGPR